MSKQQFKHAPLSQAGESGRRRVLDRLANELTWLVGAIAIVGLIGGFNIGLRLGTDFGRFITSTVSWIIFGGCLLLMALVIWLVHRRARIAVAQFENEGLGIQGERVVADALDELKRDGFRVFHDVPPESGAKGLANFDHVVIGPTGVFVIETKARSKRDGAQNRVVVEQDGRVLVNGFEPDRCPIQQSKALRAAMKSMLERQTSLRDIFVRGVVIYPDWYVNMDAYHNAGGDIWLLNQNAFKKWLTNGRDRARLTPAEVAAFSSQIESHVRSATERDA